MSIAASSPSASRPTPAQSLRSSLVSNSSLRRSTGGPYISSSLAPEAAYDQDDDEDGFAPYRPSAGDSIVTHSLAPYDTCDPEVAQYLSLGGGVRLPSSPQVQARTSPFSRSNSPIGLAADADAPSLALPSSSSSPPPSSPLPLTRASMRCSTAFDDTAHDGATAAADDDFEEFGRQVLQRLSELARRTIDTIAGYTGSAESQSMSRENRARLTFLKDTVDLLMTYLSKQSAGTLQIRAYVALLDTAAEQMEQTWSMVSRILSGATVMTPNFDIFELTLRRYQEQLAQMFPTGDSDAQREVVSRPSLVIQHAAAKAIWEEAFGPACWFVSFATFIRDIIERQFLSAGAPPAPPSLDRKALVLFLRYFLNFPVDDMVTTYKWNALVQLFGPPHNFLSNFAAYGLGRGFLGLTNRINAYEILSVKPDTRLVLIRLSRTEPEFLAFSYKNSRGEIGHQVNKGPDGRAIPIKQFLDIKFPGYTLVPERLDVAAILGKSLSSTLCDYANATQDYIL